MSYDRKNNRSLDSSDRSSGKSARDDAEDKRKDGYGYNNFDRMNITQSAYEHGYGRDTTYNSQYSAHGSSSYNHPYVNAYGNNYKHNNSGGANPPNPYINAHGSNTYNSNPYVNAYNNAYGGDNNTNSNYNRQYKQNNMPASEYQQMYSSNEYQQSMGRRGEHMAFKPSNLYYGNNHNNRYMPPMRRENEYYAYKNYREIRPMNNSLYKRYDINNNINTISNNNINNNNNIGSISNTINNNNIGNNNNTISSINNTNIHNNNINTNIHNNNIHNNNNNIDKEKKIIYGQRMTIKREEINREEIKKNTNEGYKNINNQLQSFRTMISSKYRKSVIKNNIVLREYVLPPELYFYTDMTVKCKSLDKSISTEDMREREDNREELCRSFERLKEMYYEFLENINMKYSGDNIDRMLSIVLSYGNRLKYNKEGILNFYYIRNNNKLKNNEFIEYLEYFYPFEQYLNRLEEIEIYKNIEKNIVDKRVVPEYECKILKEEVVKDNINILYKKKRSGILEYSFIFNVKKVGRENVERVYSIYKNIEEYLVDNNILYFRYTDNKYINNNNSSNNNSKDNSNNNKDNNSKYNNNKYNSKDDINNTINNNNNKYNNSNINTINNNNNSNINTTPPNLSHISNNISKPISNNINKNSNFFSFVEDNIKEYCKLLPEEYLLVLRRYLLGLIFTNYEENKEFISYNRNNILRSILLRINIKYKGSRSVLGDIIEELGMNSIEDNINIEYMLRVSNKYVVYNYIINENVRFIEIECIVDSISKRKRKRLIHKYNIYNIINNMDGRSMRIIVKLTKGIKSYECLLYNKNISVCYNYMDIRREDIEGDMLINILDSNYIDDIFSKIS